MFLGILKVLKLGFRILIRRESNTDFLGLNGFLGFLFWDGRMWFGAIVFLKGGLFVF